MLSLTFFPRPCVTLVAKLVKKNQKAILLAIVDGANDVSMIQAAHMSVFEYLVLGYTTFSMSTYIYQFPRIWKSLGQLKPFLSSGFSRNYFYSAGQGAIAEYRSLPLALLIFADVQLLCNIISRFVVQEHPPIYDPVMDEMPFWDAC